MFCFRKSRINENGGKCVLNPRIGCVKSPLSSAMPRESGGRGTIPIQFPRCFSLFYEKNSTLFSFVVKCLRSNLSEGGILEFWNFGAKLTHLCGFWLDVLFFSHLKKHRSRLWLDFSFFTCKKHRSLLWLVRTHLRMKICHIYFQWVCISVCIHCTGGTWHCIIKKDRCGVSLHHYPTPQYFFVSF